MKKRLFILSFSLTLLITACFVKAETANAQDGRIGCCEKVLKTTLTFEVEDGYKEPCEKLKENTDVYENVTFYPDKVAFLGRCRSKDDIAADSTLPKFTMPDLKVSIPGFVNFKQPDFCKGSKTEICVNWIGLYIAGIVNYATAVVGILAVIVLMLGGVRWLTAGGNSQAVSEAQTWIKNSIFGLVLTLCSYLLLVTINPSLVTFTPLRLTWIEALSLEKMKAGSGGACNNGECTQIDEAANNNSVGISGAILKSLLVGGEGCNPAVSTDGFGSCGYSQARPPYRGSICGLTNTPSDCELFKRDIQADLNCTAKFVEEMLRTCRGNDGSIRSIASCYNSGSATNCGTDNYCRRVEDYFNNKCSASGSQTNTVTNQ